MKEEKLKGRNKLSLFLFTNIILLWVVNVFWLVLNAYISAYLDNWHWFARSGSLTIIIGGALISRNALRLSRDERVRLGNMTIIERFSDLEKKTKSVILLLRYSELF